MKFNFSKEYYKQIFKDRFRFREGHFPIILSEQLSPPHARVDGFIVRLCFIVQHRGGGAKIVAIADGRSVTYNSNFNAFLLRLSIGVFHRRSYLERKGFERSDDFSLSKVAFEMGMSFERR